MGHIFLSKIIYLLHQLTPLVPLYGVRQVTDKVSLKNYDLGALHYHHLPSTTEVDETFHKDLEISSQTPRFAIPVVRSLVHCIKHESQAITLNS